MSDRELNRATIQRELRRVEAECRAAYHAGQRERQDWLYGAVVALSWVLSDDFMRPAKAFSGEPALLESIGKEP